MGDRQTFALQNAEHGGINKHRKIEMTPERWQKVKAILAEAIEVAPDLRSDYINEICDDDAELKIEVESLLAFEDQQSNLLDESVFALIDENEFEENLESLTGKKIGNYRIVKPLGTGGMGAVFLAERSDGEFSQRVALKLIKRGMDSAAVLRRFINERQILASLEHPNIARLIDGGTTDEKLPFFVMEYVEGETIIEYAERENLDLDARLKLFREVCHAVSFAHQNLVIHRDLKPSNILVTKDGEPKLLDFGIAKIHNPESGGETRTQNFVFTPEYASPEQIRGETLTTATDIYSLGIILYELLTGTRPFRTENKSISEIIKAVCETEPLRPSSAVFRSLSESSLTSENREHPTVRKKPKTNSKSKIQNPKFLKGDLDTIILKALRKEPARRYSSVEKLSEDIRRYLNGLPVCARPDTFGYRTGKFFERNRSAVFAAILVFIALIGGLAATVYQAGIARAERAKAERRFKDVRTLANSFMFEINEKIAESPIKARELLVKRATEYLDKLALESENDVELQSELATAYEKIGDVQTDFFTANLGKTSDALESQRKALKIRENLFAADKEDSQTKLNVARSHNRVADALFANSEYAEAAENYRRAALLYEEVFAAEPQNIAVRVGLCESYGKLGQIILRSGSLSESRRNYERALAIQQTLAAENPSNARFQHGLSVYHSYLGYLESEMGGQADALANFRKALEIEEKIYASDSKNVKVKSDLSVANLWFGVALRENGEMEKSLAYLQKALTLQEEILNADPDNIGERNSFADCFLELGITLSKDKKSAEAIENFQKAIENYRAVAETDAGNLAARRQIYAANRFQAEVYMEKNDTAKALELLEKSREAFRELTTKLPANTEWQHDFALCYLRIGEIALRKRDSEKARENFDCALPILEKLHVQSSEHAGRRRDLEIVLQYLAADNLFAVNRKHKSAKD
jgi:serine/threonine protein kinase/tetratricopeptide (TPR) repeat protein